MLLNILKRLTSRARPASVGSEELAEQLQEAHRVALDGDRRLAIQAYQQYLERDPSNLEALNGLGACLSEVGNQAQATKVFELAYSLDDSFVPVMVNYGKLLAENNRAAEGLQILRRAKIAMPDFTHADAVYAGLCLRLGDAAKARQFQLRSWLGNFDNLRLANCYVFWSSYDDIEEALVASEHRFWAETVRASDIKKIANDDKVQEVPQASSDTSDRRLRIGYWSPDFRNHSVRYFSRPLLDSHDRQRFEIILYHDFPVHDGHTEAQRENADHFHEVFELTDDQLYHLIASHKLDVLVELAGHSSHNRVALLTHRMAILQVSALGYPPTTGLPSIDYKIVDRFLRTPDDARHYSEEPAALASSFWCFDPKEPVPLDAEPPVFVKGHITFGCVGNIAKISERVALSWARILDEVKESRLVIRSISFQEPMAESRFWQQLDAWGLPMERLRFLQPEGGLDLFHSYNDIDIILDTYPFNGGTTTCFATYMGVPVVSLTGKSVVARMGASVLGNVGASDLAVSTIDEYVRRAVELAHDSEYLRRYKREIRHRLQDTGLGNGVKFAREFEQACVDLLGRRRDTAPAWESRIEPLPAEEIIRRAYAVTRRGNVEAAQRILDHCLRVYPNHGPGHLLLAQLMAWEGRQADAIDWLSERLRHFTPSHRIAALLSVARMHLLSGDLAAAAAAVTRVEGSGPLDPFDAAQAALYGAACEDTPPPTLQATGLPRKILVLIPCEGSTWFEKLRQQLQRTLLLPAGWSVKFERCSESERIAAYQLCRQRSDWDVLVLMQKNIVLHNPHFLAELDRGLENSDVVGFAGATRWSRLEWRHDQFEVKAGGFCGGSGENREMVELRIVGHGNEAVVGGMAVLDGRLLAIRREAAGAGVWDDELVAGQALLEEAWAFSAARQGVRLAVHRGLGIVIHGGVNLDDSNGIEARLHWTQCNGFDPFAETEEDFIALSTPARDAAEAVRIGSNYLKAGT